MWSFLNKFTFFLTFEENNGLLDSYARIKNRKVFIKN